MAYLQHLLPQTIQSVAAASVGASYSTLGTVNHEARIVRLINSTDQPVLISWDGSASNDNEFLANGTNITYNCTANRVADDGAFISSGTVFSVKRAGNAPASGSVYLVVIYTLVK